MCFSVIEVELRHARKGEVQRRNDSQGNEGEETAISSSLGDVECGPWREPGGEVAAQYVKLGQVVVYALIGARRLTPAGLSDCATDAARPVEPGQLFAPARTRSCIGRPAGGVCVGRSRVAWIKSVSRPAAVSAAPAPGPPMLSGSAR